MPKTASCTEIIPLDILANMDISWAMIAVGSDIAEEGSLFKVLQA